MKVVHVVSRATRGDGITEVVKTLASRIDRRKCEISVCSLCGRGDAVADLEQMGVKVFCLTAKSSPSFFCLPRNVLTGLRLAWFLRLNRFDVVHAHEFFSGTLGRIAGWVAGSPVVVLSLHNMDSWKKTPHIIVDRCLAKVTDRIVGNSESVKLFASAHEHIAAEKFVVIHNGIDLSRFCCDVSGRGFRVAHGIKDTDVVVGTVGQLRTTKGQKYLIEAAKIIRSQRQDVRFLIVGGDSLAAKHSARAELHQQVRDLGLDDVVEFTGRCEDIPEMMASFDIFAFPSLVEGFGLAVAEAMAAGKPVVASRIPALAEVVEDGKTGILVPPQDADALALAVLGLVKEPQRARAMGEAGKRRVMNLFSHDQMVRKYQALYESLCGTHEANACRVSHHG